MAPNQSNHDWHDPEWQQEEEDWKTVLYELDEQKAELETKVEEPTLSNGVKCTFVDITEADSDWTSIHLVLFFEYHLKWSFFFRDEY